MFDPFISFYSSMTVLIIDDDADERMILSEEFYEIDPNVILVTASRCDQGSTLLACDPLPDLVLLDETMPMENGIDCLKLIRANEKLKSITVILYTTFRPTYLSDLKKLNADFLIKPSEYKGLIKSLKAILNKD